VTTIEEIIGQVARLAIAAGVHPLAVFLGIVVMAVALVIAKKLPEPPPEVLDSPAEWNADPANGAVVVPNDEPGGWPDGKVG
jgi:hypothetical protein